MYSYIYTYVYPTLFKYLYTSYILTTIIIITNSEIKKALLLDYIQLLLLSIVMIVPKLPMAEIRPVTVKLCLYGGTEPTKEHVFNKETTLTELEQEMRKVFDISPEREVKLWINANVFTFEPKQQANNKSGDEANQHEAATSSTNESSENNKPHTPPPRNDNSTTTTTPTSSQTTSPTVVTRLAASNNHNGTSDHNSKPSAPPSESTSANSTNECSKNEYVGDKKISAISDNDSVIATLEVINADGTWPSSKNRYGAISTRSSKAQPGLCGLSNMGNTCFMNSSLQCLSNTPALTDYILADKFLEDINKSNPLGMHGEIARTYAELIKVMWSGNNSSFLPREFKCAVSRFAPQFSGFAQQDCQELLAFLLDGLHEDLNKIRVKPYIEIKSDFETRPDEVVAAESWENYKKRNDSIVVDTFHAMLKSTLVCPGCELVSVTFDPFCYLSLPLPVKREKQVNNSMSSSVAAPTKTSPEKSQTASSILKPNEDEPVKMETNDSSSAEIVSSNGSSQVVDEQVEQQAKSTDVPTEPFSTKFSPKPTLQLKDCINQFTNIERLGVCDPWYCPKCKKHQQATKKFDIWSLPKVLIIHLKRFSFSRSWRDKIDTLVEFPVDSLDMSQYVLNPEQKKSKQIYNLIGVANHFGGLGGGHYTAYAKNFVQDAWYTFDDSTVTPINPSSVVTKSAYVLFYQLQESQVEKSG